LFIYITFIITATSPSYSRGLTPVQDAREKEGLIHYQDAANGIVTVKTAATII